MGNYRARTAIELAAISSVIVLMTILIRPGQGGEDPEKIHGSLDCARCHAAVATIGETVEVPSTSSQCSSCHNRSSLNANTRLPFHFSNSRSCTECHSFHHPDMVSAGGSQFHLRFAPMGLQALCGSCHNSENELTNLSEGHRRAAQLYHSDNQLLTGLSASSACMVCHSSHSPNSDKSSLTQSPPPAFDDHSHPIGILVIPGSGRDGNRIRMTISSRIPRFGSRIECESCHSLNSTGQHLLVGSMNSTELCQACHDVS